MLREDLNSLIESNIFDNNKGLITPTMIKEVLYAVADYKDVTVSIDNANSVRTIKAVCSTILNEIDRK